MVTTVLNESGKETRVTIGLVVKNSEKTIKSCLQSILKQQYPTKLTEIIVVDGESKDQTIPIIRSMISNAGATAQFYSDEGRGLGPARQIVLDKADSKYVIWVDSDAVISGNFFQTEVDFMERNPKVAIATGMYSFRNDTSTALPALLQSLGSLVGSSQWKTTQRHGVPPTDACIYRTQALRDAGGYDTHIRGAAEDEDVMMRIRKKGWLISVNPTAKFFTLPRQTWRDIWIESSWFGYGKHYLGHKYEGLHVLMHSIPLVNFYIGIKMSLEAYRLTSQAKSFLFPLVSTFSSIAWWFGFIKADFEGYGHSQTLS